jgi:multiple sugar transport system ATP-binding protein
LGLDDLLERLPQALSGGERQRVAVGRAIVREPKAFLFDEPLSNLDAQMRVQMRIEIVRLHQRLGATMIYVTHDQVEAMAMGDRIAVMRAGVLQQIAKPMTLYHQPANLFVAGFIGSPPMNLFAGRIEVRQGKPWFVGRRDNGDPGLPLELAWGEAQTNGIGACAGKEVVMGLRPEHVRVLHPTAGKAQAKTVPAQVELVEPRGAEHIVHLNCRSHRLAACAYGDPGCSAGVSVSLAFDLAQARLFDARTEQAIDCGGFAPG